MQKGESIPLSWNEAAASVEMPLDEEKPRTFVEKWWPDVLSSRTGESRAWKRLVKRFKPLVYSISRRYFIKGAEHKDVEQVARAGLFKAIRDYRIEKGIPLASFVEICVTRNIQGAVRDANTIGNLPLNSAWSYDSKRSNELDAESMIEMILPKHDKSHAQKMDEYIEMLETVSPYLSDFERAVLDGFLAGRPYKEVAISLGCKYKMVDNAICRVKRKIGRVESGAIFLAPAPKTKLPSGEELMALIYAGEEESGIAKRYNQTEYYVHRMINLAYRERTRIKKGDT